MGEPCSRCFVRPPPPSSRRRPAVANGRDVKVLVLLFLKAVRGSSVSQAPARNLYYLESSFFGQLIHLGSCDS